MESTPKENPATPVRGRLLDWIDRHDESVPFVVLYIALAVGLSILVSLFWLVVVVAAHYALEVVRQSRRAEVHGVFATTTEAAWEIKLDLVLVAAALWLGVYLEPIFGLAGLHSAGQAARATASATQAGARTAAWLGTTRAVLITVDDLLHLGKVLHLRRKQGPDGEPIPALPPSTPFRLDTWTRGDKILTVALAVLVLSMVAAPWLLGLGVGETLRILIEDLRPLPRSA